MKSQLYPALSLLFLSTLFVSFADAQYRGSLDINVRNISNSNIRAVALDSGGNRLGAGFNDIIPNMTATFQKLAPGDRVSITANGRTYNEQLGNSSLLLIWDGTNLTGGSGGGGGQFENMPSESTITIINTTGTMIRGGVAGPPVQRGNFATGGGTMVFDIMNGESNRRLKNGATLSLTYGGKNYSMTVSRSGTLVIDPRSITFNGQLLTSDSGGDQGGGTSPTAQISFLNLTSQALQAKASGPAVRQGNYTLGGGIMMMEVPVGSSSQQFKKGAALTFSVDGKSYSMTVGLPGTLVIDNFSARFNGIPVSTITGGGGNGTGGSGQLPLLGISFRDSNGTGGLVVQSVQPGSRGMNMGLQIGDRIVSVNGQSAQRHNIKMLLNNYQGIGHAELTVQLAYSNRTVSMHARLR